MITSTSVTPNNSFSPALAFSFDGVMKLNQHAHSPMHKAFVIRQVKTWIEIAQNLQRQGETQRAKQAFEVSAAYRQLVISYGEVAA